MEPMVPAAPVMSTTSLFVAVESSLTVVRVGRGRIDRKISMTFAAALELAAVRSPR